MSSETTTEYIVSSTCCVICLGGDNYDSDNDDCNDSTVWHLYGKYSECGHVTYCKKCCDQMKNVPSICPICRCECPCVLANGTTLVSQQPLNNDMLVHHYENIPIETIDIVDDYIIPIRSAYTNDIPRSVYIYSSGSSIDVSRTNAWTRGSGQTSSFGFGMSYQF